jgi:hypothetical protein
LIFYIFLGEELTLHEKLAGEYMALRAQFNGTHAGAEGFWDWLLKNTELILRMKQESQQGKSYKCLRKMTAKHGPKVVVKCTHTSLLEPDYEEDFSGDAFPRVQYSNVKEWKLKVQSGEGSVADIKQLHLARHAALGLLCQVKSAYFSVDGVPKSNHVSCDVVSIVFDGCRTVYHIKVLKKEKWWKDMHPSFLVGDFIRQCNEEEVKVTSHQLWLKNGSINKLFIF